jgi:hypothetical protein
MEGEQCSTPKKQRRQVGEFSLEPRNNDNAADQHVQRHF